MTTEEILKTQKRTGLHDFYYEDEDIILAMKEYATIKCQELLEIVAEKAKIKVSRHAFELSEEVDKDSILNAVDLKEFIK